MLLSHKLGAHYTVGMDKDSIKMFSEFKISHDLKVAYRSYRPDIEPAKNPDYKPVHVVFCGGFHSNMLGTKAQKLEEICISHELSYTRFDYRGHGESEGAADAFTLTDWLNDTLLILDAIQEPIILVGSSMGGWLATAAAIQRQTKIKALLLIACAPDFIQELVQPRLSKSDSWDLQQGQTINLSNAYDQAHPLSQKLLDSAQAVSLFNPPSAHHDIDEESGPQDLTCPIRLIHGTADEDVPYELSIRLMNEFKQAQAQLILLHQGDHRLSDERSLTCITQELLLLVNEVQGNE